MHSSVWSLNVFWSWLNSYSFVFPSVVGDGAAETKLFSAGLSRQISFLSFKSCIYLFHLTFFHYSYVYLILSLFGRKVNRGKVNNHCKESSPKSFLMRASIDPLCRPSSLLNFNINPSSILPFSKIAS